MLDRLFKAGAIVSALAYVLGWFVAFTSAGSTSQGYFLLGLLAICWAFVVPIVGTAAVVLKIIADGIRVRRLPSARWSIVRGWGVAAALIAVLAGVLFWSQLQITLYVLPLLPVGGVTLLGLAVLAGLATAPVRSASETALPSDELDPV